MTTSRTKLSAAMLALLAAGASAPVLFDQFTYEQEGNVYTAVVDPGGIWSLCHGVTVIDGKRVIKGQTATKTECQRVNAIERDKALAWVDRNIRVPLTPPQKVGIASFCPYNIGPAKCFTSTFYAKINAGDRLGACAEIRRWIFDGGRDCRLTKGQKDGCYGQVDRRDQESALACWEIDK
ncbi:phage lysozyme [Trabulsiella guamensis ATCC 49490]|uniref:Lysozyme n=1 Tax=Trabulsiella guamensis ATCC 49490 TaxID=1005994 RepID=A0A085AE51_9ENTR|nr:lysozyme [Trabulsiella guamensis]KFC08496.1 phage lysozyme [Trabulsiella guamensis ATCC 49490]